MSTPMDSSVLREAPLASANTTSLPRTALWKELVPLCLLVFFSFLAVGLPLPVLPAYLHDALGYGAMVVGAVLGLQSWATVLTRHTAGTWSDLHGPRRSVLLGVFFSTLSAMLYALSQVFPAPIVWLLLGRLSLGLGESFVITGALSWGMTLAGRERSGLVLSWLGIAMYSALAVGAPLGTQLHATLGFSETVLVSAAMPLIALAMLALLPVVPVLSGGARLPFYRVLSLLWLPGLGLASTALSFGAIGGYTTLHFRAERWPHAPFVMTAFGVAYVLARLFFGSFPDRFGGARVAVAASLLTVAGQFGLWIAPTAVFSVGSAALTGLGYSLAFPAFGVEALRAVPPHNRGVALGAYTACFDLALGAGIPLLGVVVNVAGYRAVFATTTLTAALSFAIALLLTKRSRAAL